MHYDPVKRFLGSLFNRHPISRKLFYRLLDILLLRSWHLHKALRAYRSSVPKDREVHVLDAGSGLGQHSWYLARKNPAWHITAVDIKEEELESCASFFSGQQLTNVVFEKQDLTSYFKPDAFDLVLSVDVMEHIEEDEQVFSRLYASMKKGGLLLISTPSDQGGSDVRHPGGVSFIEEHVRDGYAAEELKQKLQKAGFKTIETHYTYGKPGSIAWRLSVKYPISLLNRSKAFLLLLPLYYIFVMPPVLILNKLDVVIKHKKGTGLLVKAWK
ncbi:MAG: class I SAM-dependent methyltransferase [Bacteroidales bacterium]|nr:class I SAM-dependent methyltransferase [Bacteroidales bacterium]